MRSAVREQSKKMNMLTVMCIELTAALHFLLYYKNGIQIFNSIPEQTSAFALL